MCFNRDCGIFSLNKKPLELEDHFINLGSNISSAESYVNLRTGKAWIVHDRLSTILQSDLSDKIKHDIFQSIAVSVLLYGYIN